MARSEPPRRRLLAYAPSGGHTDQLRDLSLALALARLLNRSLLLPRLLSHRDATYATSETDRVRFARQRPPISVLMDLSWSGVHLVDDVDLLVRMHKLPRCESGHASGPESCVMWMEPPEAHQSVGALLRRLAAAPHHSWISFSSMRDVASARNAKRYPLSKWESLMAPAPCTVRYRADLLAAARRALGSVLGRPAYEEGRREGRQDASGGAPFYLAAHVRALPEGRGKSEPAHEWLPRLVNFTSLHCGRRQRHGPGHGPLRPSPCTLYIATDDPAGVLPRAASALEPCAVGALCDVNVTVVSGAAAAGILAPSMLPPRPRHHPTPTALIDVQQQAASEAALLAADVAAVLGARHFSPAPRSGLSVHYTATRACEGVGGAAEHDGWRPAPGTCDPAAAACVPFASSGCGGAFPRLLLEGPPLCSTLRRKARSPGDELCVDSQGVERQYYCP